MAKPFSISVNSTQKQVDAKVLPVISRRSSAIFFAVRIFLPLLLVCSIYLPEHYTFSVDRTSPPSEVLKNLSTIPVKDVLDEVAAILSGTSFAVSDSRRKSMADALLEGQLIAPGLQSGPVPLIGWPADLLHGGPSFQLTLASLELENLLLEEFEHSGDRRYYQVARDRILAFAVWEAQQRSPIAFLWNDHAIAARISVMVRLWQHLRGDTDATVAQKEALIGLVMRSGELLAKPKLFTVRTNHGVMQNIALLQIAAAFPLLPKTKYWRDLAIERLELQLGFYVSDEGVVLEHSAGYHLLGTQLLAAAARLIRLNGMAPSERLVGAIQGTEQFSRALLRPDGTLPAFGNTDVGSRHALTVISDVETSRPKKFVAPFSPPAETAALFPISGYALWWSHSPVPAQTVVAWANHLQHGHKHADEPSLNIWSRGYDWITGTGYWPYGLEGFAEANGWAGSNAPHSMNEPAGSPRQARLRGAGNEGPLRVADIEVCRRSGMCVRRQVVQLSAEQLIIVDETSNSDATQETLWTTDPRLTLRQIGKLNFASSATETGQELHIALAGNVDPEVALLRGSMTPFAGWVVSKGSPRPADAIRVTYRGADVATATLIEVTELLDVLSLQSFSRKDSEDWRVALTHSQGDVIVERKGRNVSIKKSSETSSVTFTEPPEITERQVALRSAMNEAIHRYPPWRDLSAYHFRLLVLIALLWLVTEVGILALRNSIRQQTWLQLSPLAGWIALALWIHYSYLT